MDACGAHLVCGVGLVRQAPGLRPGVVASVIWLRIGAWSVHFKTAAEELAQFQNNGHCAA